MNKRMIKRRYDPIIGRYVKKDIITDEIHGEGLMDIFKSIGSTLFGKATKEIAKRGAKKTATLATNKIAEYAGNRAGDTIVKLLQKKQKSPQIEKHMADQPSTNKQLSDFEIAQRVNQLISGGRMMKR